MIKGWILVLFVTAASFAGALAQKPRTDFCTADGSKGTVACMCLSYHPDFCSEEGPIPSCCKVTEEGSGAHECHCCGSGKKAATVEERGSYVHIR